MHFVTVTVEDESTWGILEVIATCLRRSKPKNQNPLTPIQTKTYKIPKPIHEKIQIFQHKSNLHLQTTTNPPPAHRKDRELRERDEEAIWRKEKEELWDEREI